MGGSNSTNRKIIYKNGRPTFKGDEVVKGFERDNGLLFRIVKRKKGHQTWAFYNDTTQYNMRINVTFAAGCELTALGHTKVVKGERGEWVATVVVMPGKTEMFVEGKIEGFKSNMDAYPVMSDGNGNRLAAGGAVAN
ncbi:putative calpain-like cysteine peptidase [Leishmania major strain Friedlin]|uniref:Putative calpain-like cysteine peptidase n=1 Tax=Leishmania major TaxID=5664 RepID=Q5SDH4_LEIMA|nr:putative calpain-like cysteine peptidase [Leishmania major strain Friedlin]AAV59018.1 small myristoylated protein 2 [Leishmania major]CAG9573204.1 small_myristoylated_protein-2 [Leishmania major strain Friedlin]CAJ04265.1 putative calpain-like cysteine peptidase [Leishmania major strain Friedlin]|eukprot:XP_001682882.1 putative calpain-like cysteine peptidase [Leishmania major strain Friedlin]